MKKGITILIITAVLVILILTSLIVYANNDNQDVTLEEKVSQEIQYLNSYLISMLGHFNGLSVGNDIFQIGLQKNNIGNSTQSSQSGGDSSNTMQQESTKENGSQNNESKSNQGENDSQSGKNQSNQGENGTSKQEQNDSSGQTKTQQGNKSQSQNDQSGPANMQQNSILANNGEYKTNWDMIQLQIEKLYQTWNTISIDLHALNVDGSSILAFSDGLNNATQNVKKKEKTKSMEQLAKLHQMLPNYIEGHSNNKQQIDILKILSKVVTAYVGVTNDKWQDAEKELTQAEQDFANMLNTVTNMEKSQNSATMNQCYILVNELRNAVKLKDKEIYYIQYENFITKIGILVS